MSVRVRIPSPLRRLTNELDVVSIDAQSVGELFENLEAAHPGVKSRVCDEKGRVRRFVNVFVGENDIRYLQDLDTELKPGDEVAIVPAIAGGR